MKQDGEGYLVRGEQAKKMMEELKRSPTQAEIDRLKKAMKNRIGNKGKGSAK